VPLQADAHHILFVVCVATRPRTCGHIGMLDPGRVVDRKIHGSAEGPAESAPCEPIIEGLRWGAI